MTFGERFVFLVCQTGSGSEIDHSNGYAHRVASNEDSFRACNERIEATNEHFGVALEGTLFVCECANETCTERITLAIEEYEEVRSFPTRFIVVAGHVYPEYERVVANVDGYMVVEKFGEAGKEAFKLDERRRDGHLHVAG